MDFEIDQIERDGTRTGSLVEHLAVWVVRLVLLPIWLVGIFVWVLAVLIGAVIHGVAAILYDDARGPSGTSCARAAEADTEARSALPTPHTADMVQPNRFENSPFA